MHEVDLISHRLKLPAEVRRRAAMLSAEARPDSFVRGTKPRMMAAATVYVACRENKIPVTLRDMAEASGSDTREVGRCYLALLDQMHIARPNLNGREYVRRLVLRTPVSEKAYELSQEIINRMSAGGFGGRNPMTLAAAALYLACCNLGERVTQSEVAEAAGVGEESVRECCKAIRVLEHQTTS